MTTSYTYNKANLVTSLTNTMGDVVISSFAYTYYADGNMYTKAETQLTVTTNTTYVYDGMGRLKSETKGEDVISYYYDTNGNRTLMNNDGNITSYTYDKNNRLLTESANGETITYTYDANGNTLTAGDKTYTYNSRGQQIGYADGTTTASYAYNPSGLRTAKTVGGSTKYFVYNGMQIVFEYEDSVSDGTTYYYGLNRTHSSDGDIFVYNAHGDTVQLVNNNAVVVSYTYDAFGNLTNTIGESDNAFLYCSEYFDAETQTYYLRARYYNPANGRFTQQDAWEYIDTVDPLSLNLYTYCGNNPLVYMDPSGNSPVINAIQWMAENIYKPTIDFVQDNLGKIDLTYSTGYSASGSPSVFVGTAQVGVSIDTKGNIALQGSLAGGFTTSADGWSGSIVKYQTITNASNVDKLNGYGLQIGGSTNIPILDIPIIFCGGKDLNIIPDGNSNRVYLGLTSSTGISSSVGSELHVEWGETETLFKANVFDLFDTIYNWVMEW